MNNENDFSDDVIKILTTGIGVELGKKVRINYYDLKTKLLRSVLFNFSGLLLEFMPKFIEGNVKVDYFDNHSVNNEKHLCPGMFFSGSPNNNSSKIISALQQRYNQNFICGLASHKGKIPMFIGLKEYVL